MGLAFLAPIFFAGLLALAIPILVHLTHRQKAIVVPFPSLMFLRRVPFRSMRRQKIRHWLLFLTRCAAIVLLASAFTRPFIDRPGVTATLSAESREVVILLDRSYSMAYGDRWNDAVDAVRETIAGLTPSDRASLVFFADAAQLAVRSTAESSVLLGALEAIRPTFRPTRYGPAFGIAQQLLNESDLPAREVVLISDYQKSGWDAQQDTQLPEGTNLINVDVATDASSNLSIADIILQREASDATERLVVSARLVNQGETDFDRVEVALEIEGERVEAREVDLAGNSATTVQFRPVSFGDGTARGTVSAGDDALAGDNAFHFVAVPGETLNVLILENPRAQATDSYFLEQALSVGTRPAFRVRRKSVAQLQADDLVFATVVVMNDAPYPGGGNGAALRRLVEEGGGLIVALGELVSQGEWQSNNAAALVPGFGDPLDRSADFGGTLASYDRTHRVFEIFRAPRSGDFTAASFYRYRPLEGGADDRVLAGLDDGTAALVARGVGDGRVLVWGGTLDRFWNDLPTQPVYVPFVHQMVQYAAGYLESPAWQTVGGALQVARIEEAGIPEGTRVAVTQPSGARLQLAAGSYGAAADASLGAEGRLDLDAPGFYSLTWVEDDQARDLVLAANLERTESDLAKIDSEELAAAVAWRGGAGGGLVLGGEVDAADRESQQSFWWYLLVVAFAVLAFDTLLSNRISSSSVTPTA